MFPNQTLGKCLSPEILNNFNKKETGGFMALGYHVALLYCPYRVQINIMKIEEREISHSSGGAYIRRLRPLLRIEGSTVGDNEEGLGSERALEELEGG